MGNGPLDSWYLSLQRAPWTPPNWVFGTAWAGIMLCFAVYMTVLQQKRFSDYVNYAVILILCAAWNHVFFNQQLILAGLLILLLLTAMVFFVTAKNLRRQRYYSGLLLPFCVWTVIASSLNAYLI